MNQKTKKTVSSTPRAKRGSTDFSTQLTNDFKNSLLLISLLVNLVFLTAWIALQVTNKFDSQISYLLFAR